MPIPKPRTANTDTTKCEWVLDGVDGCWRTQCDRAYDLDLQEPKEANYNFCPNCGKPLLETR
jgi:hypothetical protein